MGFMSCETKVIFYFFYGAISGILIGIMLGGII